MAQETKTVDGFKFLPPKLSKWIQTFIPDAFDGQIPFQPLAKPLDQARISTVTSAGISLKTDMPFDMETEKKTPTYGDPSFREIPKGTTGADIDVNHLHINCSYIFEDIDVMLPLTRLAEFSKEGIIGELAPTSYSFYGFQWESTDFISQAIAPMTEKMKAEAVDAVVLTPA